MAIGLGFGQDDLAAVRVGKIDRQHYDLRREKTGVERFGQTPSMVWNSLHGDGAGSVVQLDGLSSFGNDAPGPDSGVEARNDGSLNLTSGILTVANVDVIVTETGNFNVGTLDLLSGSILSGDGTFGGNVTNGGWFVQTVPQAFWPSMAILVKL